MTYPELATIDSTPDQDLALQIAFKAWYASLSPEEQQGAPSSPGAYLAARVNDVLNSYAAQHVQTKKVDIIKDAFAQATPQEQAAAAAALNVDIDIKVPPDVGVP